MMMKSEKIGCIVTMLMALFVLSCTSDETLSNTDSLENVPVSLAMNVSTNNASTRMTEEMTQQEGQVFRGIRDQRLFPFDADALNNNLIASGKQPLSTYITNLNKYNEETDNLHYFDDRSVKIPNGTAAFLCYCRAIPSGSKFANGSLITNVIKENAGDELDLTNSSTSDILFEPEKIYTDVENDEVMVPAAATVIADYLTAIAAAVKATPGKEELYRLLTNGSVAPDAKNHTHLLACSSTNVAKLAEWVAAEGVNLSSLTAPTANYPAEINLPDGVINLPDGVAVVKWDNTLEQFVPQVQTNTDVNNINSLNRFVYPAELYYYANSRIKTSRKSIKLDYSNKSWADVLAKYDPGYGKMDVLINSVAIIDPLSYAVGCLQVGLNVSSTLEDAAEPAKTITLKDGKTEGENASFPLTAVLISGQFAQGYDFTPKGEADEYIIYDKTIEGAISMGAPTLASSTKYTNTLVLQTKNGENVRFALEFENNSGVDFQGINGTVFKGTKFYLVGQIKVPVDQDQDYKKRVFTKNHITKGVVTISSLKEAYTYLPDLLDPRLEVGIQLVPNWIQVTTTNVPL
ncbi:MAG: hypothetical protein J5790_10125 [Bacteroidaceae bacterium]|nr:hypothetical protein [Bacteroidaceae bacterium]